MNPDHRTWAPPRTPWILSMRWHDLLFLHWPIRSDLVRPLIPEGLELDMFDGSAWIGIVPFRMSGVGLRFLPGMAFPELNVRTYVKHRGKSGVWFFSLDAGSRLAVRAARLLGLPYFDARMRAATMARSVDYQSVRIHRNAPPAAFSANYGPDGAVYYSAAASLDRWLTARYCLYAVRRKQIVSGEIDHPPWPLQPAAFDLRANTMTAPLGIALPDTAPIAHFARELEVVAWPIVKI